MNAFKMLYGYVFFGFPVTEGVMSMLGFVKTKGKNLHTVCNEFCYSI